MNGACRRPNIVLITTDQQRFDTLGVNGNHRIQTPNIDALARSGVNFSNAYVQNTVCVPSRACIQTGRYTHQHGVTYMETVVDDTPGLPEWEPTFMELLQAQGYRTGAAGKIHMYPEKGFDWHRLTGGKGQRWLVSHGSPLGPGPMGPNYEAWLEAKRPGAYEEIYAERRAQRSYREIGTMDTPVRADEYIDYWIADEAIRFIQSNLGSDGPFFLWAGFCGPHGPMDPPAPYRDMYPVHEVPLPAEIRGWPSWRDKWGEELMRRCIAYYWAMVTCIDDQVGQIVSFLRERGALGDTLFIFTSDHGEMLGERGRMGKGVFYDSVLRVPLWIKPPEGAACTPREASGLVENMSIAPTILDYAGITIPDRMSARSLREMVEGASATDHEPQQNKAVFSEYVDNSRKRWGKCIRTVSHKYVKWWGDDECEELYDLAADPIEEDDLSGSTAHADLKMFLRQELTDWLARTEWRHNY